MHDGSTYGNIAVSKYPIWIRKYNEFAGSNSAGYGGELMCQEITPQTIGTLL